MDKDVSYPVHKGYLVKSPPDTRVTKRMKSWRKRWFILRQDKSLEYYEEKGGEKKFIKKIDLNLCTFLDTHLSHKRFENIFSITIKGKNSGGRQVNRIYFLVADTAYEMKLWIDEICKLCDFQIANGHANGSDEGSHETGPTTKSSAGIDNEHCPLGNADKMEIRNARDSGIQITPTENNNNSDLVAVSPPATSVQYDYVPPPRPADPRLCDNEGEESGDDSQTYDVPPPHSSASNYNVVPASRRLTERSCPLDISSSSESSLSGSQRRSSNECDDYDFPSRDHVRPPVYSNVSQALNSEVDQPSYDVPPCLHSTYDVVPPRVGGEYSNLPCTIPLGMAEIDYDNVPNISSEHYQSPNPSNSNYDTVPPPHGGTLPSNLQMYDTVPPPHGGILPSNGNLPTYDSVPPPRGAFSSNSNLHVPMYDSVPPHRTLPVNSVLSTYDTVPQHRASDTYDSVPPPVPYSRGSAEIYDVVPSHSDTTDNNAEDDTPAPPIPRASKPTAYVNLTLPIDDSYNKPLPIPPDISGKLERDSGSYCGLDVYDVPPQKHGVQVPSVDRSSKPVLPPTVNRFSKPDSIKSGDYVNIPSRSYTVRDVGRQPKGVNLNRSKSAAGDSEPDAYLYMESPKRTQSSLRFSRKDSFLDTAAEEEEDGDTLSYEYMEPQARHESDPYQNFDPQDLKQPTQSDAAPEKKLKGHYQDIDIVWQREAPRPAVPERHPNTNYTTIDLEKTKGFRKTCAGTANQVGRDASRQ